jgi:dienelactone hydrolase
VYAPDYLFGDPVPADDTVPADVANFDIVTWLDHHGPNVTLPAIHAVQDALREKGVEEFAATGYCFGGLYILLLSQSNDIKVRVSEWPSNVYLWIWAGCNDRTPSTLAGP